MTCDFKYNPLPVLISARVRITDEQRRELKDAYYSRKNALQPAEASGTGGLVVTTSYDGSNDLDKQLGFSNLVFSDIVNSRDTININIVLKLQAVLEVELISKEKLMEACGSYADYIFMKFEDA